MRLWLLVSATRTTTQTARNAKRNYVGLTNYVQKWEINCATFCGAGGGMTSLWLARWLHMKKASGFPEALHSRWWRRGGSNPDLLTASQALSQLSYAPVRRSTIRELPRRCKENFGKTFRGGGIAGSRPRAPGSEQGTRLTTDFQPVA